MKNFLVKVRDFMRLNNRWVKLAACLLLSVVFGFHTGIIAMIIVEYEAWKAQGKPMGIAPFKKGSGVDWWALLMSLISCLLGGSLHFFLFGAF